MNVDLLKTAYAENGAVQAICDHLAGRNNNQNETKLDRITVHLQKEAYEFKRAELIAAFRRLEEVGAGKYVEGRHGWPSRFIWETKSLYVAALASNGEIPTQAIDSTVVEVEEEADFIEHTTTVRLKVEQNQLVGREG